MSKVALVTGASPGIGAAIARLLHERGFAVFGTSLKADLRAGSTEVERHTDKRF